MDLTRVEFSLATYKDALEMQKQLMEMLLEKNLQNNVSSVEKSTAKAVENIVQGNKVSIYA